MKRACFSFLAFALAGPLAFGQPAPKPADPKVAAPGTDPKDKPPETPKLPADDPLLKEALKHFEKGEVKECLAKLKEATDKNKDLQPPEVIFASWLVQARRGSDARQVLEQFIARNAGHPDGYLLNASFAYGEGRITDAVHNCLSALNYSRDPQWNTSQQKRFDREARLGLVASLEARGDFRNMVEHVQALVNADPMNAALRQRLAAVKFNIGQDQTALAELVEAYKLDPAIDPPELRMGALWASKAAAKTGKTPEETAAAQRQEIEDNRKEAEKFLNLAVQKYPDNAKCPRGLASFYLEEGKFNEALNFINQAAALDAKVGKKEETRETASLRALLHRYKAEYTQAVPLFEKLFSQNPADPFATGNLAICLMETGEKDRATNLANSLVKGNDKSAEAYAVLGWVLFRTAKDDKEFEAADQAFAKAASGGQAMLDTGYYIAENLNRKKKYKEAFDLLKDAVGKKGAFVYRVKANELLKKVEPNVPKDEPKKEEPKK